MNEDIFIPLIVFSFVLLLVKMLLDHSKWKRAQSGSKPKQLAERSMSLSELEDVFQDTIDTSIAPVEARIARIEKQLRQLSAAEPRQMLSEGDPTEKLEDSV